MKRLLIIGASGHGKVCADIAEKMGLWDEIVFADDNPPTEFPFPIIGKTDIAWNEDCFVGIGDAEIRKKLSYDRKLVTLIHPTATIGSRVSIGEGSVVMAGAVVNPDSIIGAGAIINTGSSVDHDCRVADYAHISVGAHLGGTTIIGESTWIGAGAIVINNVSVCAGCMIGAGAVIISDISDKGTYVGVPAKRIK